MGHFCRVVLHTVNRQDSILICSRAIGSIPKLSIPISSGSGEWVTILSRTSVILANLKDEQTELL